MTLGNSKAKASKNIDKITSGKLPNNKAHVNEKKIRNRAYWILRNGVPVLKAVNDNNEDLSTKRFRNCSTDGINSITLKKHPLRGSGRPQSFFGTPISSLEIFFKYEKLFKHFNVPIDRNVVVCGAFETNRHTLQRQLIPDKKGEFSKLPFDGDMEYLDKAVSNSLRKLRIRENVTCDEEDILYCEFNPNTYPGFRFSEHFLISKKRDCVHSAVMLARKRWNKIIGTKGKIYSRNEISPSIYTIGARNKRDLTYEDGDLAGSRVVHMPEFHCELTNGVWTDRITEHIKEIARGPIYIGNSLVKSKRLEKDCEDSHFILEGDWKRFDSSLYAKVILKAVAILRCYYPLDDEDIDKHFLAIYDSVAIKDYHLPGGKMVRAFHGLPSGVKSTNLLGSLINLICLNFCVNRGDNKKFKFITGGDDFLVVCNDENENSDTLIKEFYERAALLGMEFKFLRKKEFCTTNVEEKPCFYKYAIDKKEAIIPTSALLERCFCPWNKRYKEDIDLFKFLLDLMPSLGRPSSHLLIYYIFLMHVGSKVFSNRIHTMSEYINLHISIYKRVCDKADTRFYREKEELFKIAGIYLRDDPFTTEVIPLRSGFVVFQLL